MQSMWLRTQAWYLMRHSSFSIFIETQDPAKPGELVRSKLSSLEPPLSGDDPICNDFTGMDAGSRETSNPLLRFVPVRMFAHARALIISLTIATAFSLATPVSGYAQVQPGRGQANPGQANSGQANPGQQQVAPMGALRPQTSTSTLPQIGNVPTPPGAPAGANPPAMAGPAADSTNLPPSVLQLPAHRAVVRVAAGGLYIKAENSNLSQILHDIAAGTGTKISGLSGEERIFGTYGPGNADEVMDALLYGSDYNVLMIGSIRAGAPREIVLTRRSNAPVTPVYAAPVTRSDDDSDAGTPYEDQDASPPPNSFVPGQQRIPPPPQNEVPSGSPNDPVRTPQQLLEELQQLHRPNDGTQNIPQSTAPQ